MLKTFQHLSEVWEVLGVCNYKRARHKRVLPEHYKRIAGKHQQASFFLVRTFNEKTFSNHSYYS